MLLNVDSWLPPEAQRGPGQVVPDWKYLGKRPGVAGSFIIEIDTIPKHWELVWRQSMDELALLAALGCLARGGY